MILILSIAFVALATLSPALSFASAGLRSQSRDHNRVQQLKAKPTVSIEYCTGCKWLLRSAWLAQELLTTFERDLGSVSLQPNSDRPGGVFIVRIDGQVIWDRTKEETKGFPESKELKQLVRDIINPDMSLGHSDKVIEIPAEWAHEVNLTRSSGTLIAEHLVKFIWANDLCSTTKELPHWSHVPMGLHCMNLMNLA